MPNVGRPSRDCHLCRSRRVKCDLTRPACLRCAKYGAECPGYRTELELAFRVSTVGTVAKRQRRSARKPQDEAATKQPPIESNNSGPSSAVLELATRTYSTPLFMEIQQSWQEHSEPLVLQCFGRISFLQTIFRTSSSDESLSLVTRLFARAFMTNHFMAPDDPKELQYYLYKTLRSVSAALQDPARSVMDSMVATVWLLGNYEVLVGSIERERLSLNPWHIHVQGLISLLRARGPSQLLSDSGRATFWSAYNLIQTQCVLANTTTPPESAQWLAILQATRRDSEELQLQLAAYNEKAVPLLIRILALVRGGSPTCAATALPTILQEVDAADAEMTSYIAAHPEMSAILAHHPKEPMAQYMVHCWRATRIKLHYFVVMLLNYVQYTPRDASTVKYDVDFIDERRQASVAVAAAAGQAVVEASFRTLGAHTVAAGAGTEVEAEAGVEASLPASPRSSRDRRTAGSPEAWFQALQLVWPLTIVMCVLITPRETRLMARYALGIIGRQQGILQALKKYSVGMQMPEEAMRGFPSDDICYQRPMLTMEEQQLMVDLDEKVLRRTNDGCS